MIKEVYSVDYDGAFENSEWIVKGPGTYIRYGDDRQSAYEWAARLNNAYLLGYAAYNKNNSDLALG
jgi:hypothetical protein